MIKFEDIAFGDLLYLEAGEYNAEGWHAVTVCYGTIREVALLEDKGPIHGTSLYPSDAHMIYKHIRVSGIPAAIEALRELAKAEAKYREALISFGARDPRTGLAWETMHQAGNAARDVLKWIDAPYSSE